jgi:phage terminase large subunit GpA-like protein
MRSIFYETYINSEAWRLRREAVFRRAQYQCQRCGEEFWGGHSLQVHHLTYDRLGHELDEDLLVVCIPCHEKEDQEHAWRTQQNQWAARLDGWASKRYGDNWDDYRDYDQVEEEFESWLDRQDEW